jgi:FtsZ-binding cell division protein ZapB
VDEDTIKLLEDGLKKQRDTLIKQRDECYSNIKDFVMDDTIVDACEGMVTESCDTIDLRQNVEELKKEREDLKAKIDNCCGCCQPIKDDLYKNAFDILGYAVLIRLCVDILEEARKHRPNITIDDIINGVNEGKIKLSLYGYDISSPDSGKRPKVEFVD